MQLALAAIQMILVALANYLPIAQADGSIKMVLVLLSFAAFGMNAGIDAYEWFHGGRGRDA